MTTNIYVGNLSFQTTEGELETVFAQYGTVERVSVIRDRDTGQSRGFAFVEMADGGDAAINGLNGTDLNGRSLTVNEARPREERGGFGGGGGGRGAGRSSGGGGGFGGGRGKRREPRW
jgi:RNA recognition motif-containing protein